VLAYIHRSDVLCCGVPFSVDRFSLRIPDSGLSRNDGTQGLRTVSNTVSSSIRSLARTIPVHTRHTISSSGCFLHGFGV
jgi:hypothetical protein